MDALAEADLALIVNPNNPDGRVVPVARLLALAERMARAAGFWSSTRHLWTRWTRASRSLR